jgi:hypothetical protein
LPRGRRERWRLQRSRSWRSLRRFEDRESSPRAMLRLTTKESGKVFV